MPLPNTFHELFGMCSAIRAPNALRESDYYALHKIGGPKFRSISASCAAALFRTSLVTVTSWPLWIQQLEECAKQCLPYVQHSTGIISPPPLGHWPNCLEFKKRIQRFPQLPQMGGRRGHFDQQTIDAQWKHTNKSWWQVCAKQVRVTKTCLQCAYGFPL